MGTQSVLINAISMVTKRRFSSRRLSFRSISQCLASRNSPVNIRGVQNGPLRPGRLKRQVRTDAAGPRRWGQLRCKVIMQVCRGEAQVVGRGSKVPHLHTCRGPGRESVKSHSGHRSTPGYPCSLCPPTLAT